MMDLSLFFAKMSMPDLLLGAAGKNHDCPGGKAPAKVSSEISWNIAAGMFTAAIKTFISAHAWTARLTTHRKQRKAVS
jgi:hypothetical protein